MNPYADLSSLRLCSPLNSFTLVHRGVSYPVNPTLLSLASPKIARLLSAEPTLSAYALPPVAGPAHQFISLLFGEPIDITVVNCRFLAYLARDLEIATLERAALDIAAKSDTLPRVLEFAADLLAVGLPADAEIRQLAQNFKKVPPGSAARWPAAVLKAVLLSEFLEAENYSQLVRTTVLPLIAQDCAKNGALLAFVRLAALDNDAFRAVVGSPYVDLNLVKAHAAEILKPKKSL
jgi:hypothetical protein